MDNNTHTHCFLLSLVHCPTTSQKMKNKYIVALIVFIVIALDQTLKIYLKTHFCYGETYLIFGKKWAQINFQENAGAAFSYELRGEYGKLALSVFRIFAISALIYLGTQIRKKVPFGLLVSYAFILAGAIGNMIDSAFYGLIFSDSDFTCIYGPAKYVGFGHGYSKFLHGRVVDMLYFPLGHYPKFIPFIGGQVFFNAIFNIADAAISIGVFTIFIFYTRFFNADKGG